MTTQKSSAPVDPTELLTKDEHEAITKAGQLYGLLCRIVGTGPTRGADLNELIPHIHAIQQAVMSQAAGRAYPMEYRLLGETLRPSSEESA